MPPANLFVKLWAFVTLYFNTQPFEKDSVAPWNYRDASYNLETS